MNVDNWKDGELAYLCRLVTYRGDDKVGSNPLTISTYLRVQAADAFRQGYYKLSACIADAATAINCDARNKHAPNWDRALASLNLAYTGA